MARKTDTSIGEAFEALFQQREEEGLKCLSILESPGVKDAGLSSIVRASWAETFLTALARHGTFMVATRVAGVTRQTVYDTMERYPEFAQAVEVARHEFAEMLETVAIARAMNGSERLLEFLLRGALPHKYREVNPSVTVNTSPIIVDVIADNADKLADSSFSALE